MEEKIELNYMDISNSGHFMMIDNPQEFYQKLSNIL
jgi:hypothetical protein